MYSVKNYCGGAMLGEALLRFMEVVGSTPIDSIDFT